MYTHLTEAVRTRLARLARPLFAAAVCGAALSACGERPLPPEGDFDQTVDAIPTATPIKHLIIIVGENRSFDHLFATYVPQHPEERIHNLLSEGIVTAAGQPGPNFKLAYQYKITSPPNGGKYWISADLAQKTL
jgi:phospholipase C